MLRPSYVSQSTASRVNLHFTSWHPKVNTLRKAVLPKLSAHYSFVHSLYHDDDAHRCFGSVKPNAPAVFHFRLPPACDIDGTTPCSVKIGYLASWNVTYTGDVECSLHNIANNNVDTESEVVDVNDANRVGRPMKIFGSGSNSIEHMRSTGPVEVTLQFPESSRLGAGEYILRCVKDATPRLSCFTGIKISNSFY